MSNALGMNELPSEFLSRLRRILPDDAWDDAVAGFRRPDPLCLRVNTLKITRQDFVRQLRERQLDFRTIPWCDDAVLMDPGPAAAELLPAWDEQGAVYRQNPSSLVPVIALNPRPEQDVLDLCAAPGGKSAHMAALMRNTGTMYAVETVRSRYYKLKNVLTRMGVANARLCCLDGRRFRRQEGFDRILVDAPCSSEARFHVGRPESFQYWSLRKIKEMTRKHRGLILNAGRLLRPGGVLVYSTCAFNAEENEGVVDWFLRKQQDDIEVLPVDIPGLRTYPALQHWEGKEYASPVAHCLRVRPDADMQAFFVACLVRKGGPRTN